MVKEEEELRDTATSKKTESLNIQDAVSIETQNLMKAFLDSPAFQEVFKQAQKGKEVAIQNFPKPNFVIGTSKPKNPSCYPEN